MNITVSGTPRQAAAYLATKGPLPVLGSSIGHGASPTLASLVEWQLHQRKSASTERFLWRQRQQLLVESQTRHSYLLKESEGAEVNLIELAW